MFKNKILINLYVASIDKNFEIYFPVNEKVGNVIKLLKKSLLEHNGVTNSVVLINTVSGNIYRNNDIIRETDIKNGSKLILI